MMRKRLMWIVLGAGGLVMLGGLLAVFLSPSSQQEPQPAAQAPPLAVQVEEAPAAPLPAPAWVPLSAMAVVDELIPEAPKGREAELEFVQGLFRAEGLEIRPDGSTTYVKLGQPELGLSMRLAEVAAYRGREKLRTLELNPAPQREVVNENRRGRLTFLDIAPGLDLRFDYDGISVKETFTVQQKLVDELAALDGAELRITYRFDELRSAGAPLQFRSGPVESTLSTGNLSAETTLYLGRTSMPEFELPPAFAEGGPGGKLFLERRLDLTDKAHPQLTVRLPTAYLQGASSAITIDPTVIDQYQSMDSVNYGDPFIRTPDGSLVLAYRRYLRDPNGGAWRWSVVWAKGKGMDWKMMGHLAPARAASTGHWTHQEFPSLTVTSDGTIHAAWYEYYRGDFTGEGVNRWQIAHAYKKPDADAFVSTGFAAKDLGSEQHFPMLLTDRFDNVYMLFYNSGRASLMMWDPAGVSNAMQPPPPVGAGGYKQVEGAWVPIITFTVWQCSEFNMDSKPSPDKKDKLVLNFTRCRPGVNPWEGTPDVPLDTHPSPSTITWSWDPKAYITNDPGFGGAMNDYPLFGPSVGGNEDNRYTYGDPGATNEERRETRWYRMQFSGNEVIARDKDNRCFEIYYHTGDWKMAWELVNPPNRDKVDDGDIFYVSRLQMYNYNWNPWKCINNNGSSDPPYDIWYYRTFFARYDASRDRWVDHTLLFGPNIPKYNRFQEEQPKVAVSPDGTVHALTTRYGVPYQVLYRKRTPSDGLWEDWRPLVPGGQMTYHGQVRGRNWPKGVKIDDANDCPRKCTVLCAEQKKCGDRVDQGTLDIAYTMDGSKIIYVSTGQPAEMSQLRRPLNHSYVQELKPQLTWTPISTDRPNVLDVCYKLELARKPLFRDEDMVYQSPAGSPGWASYICSDSLNLAAPVPAGQWLNGYNGTLVSGEYYYWRVTPINEVGTGFASPVFEFGVDNTPPSAFSLIEPGKTAAECQADPESCDPKSKTPTFKWQASCDPPLVRKADNTCGRP